MDILLVDDEPTILMSVSEALRAQGHHVALAHDGALAQTMLRNRVYDLLICDIRLPRVDGMTIFRQVRHESPSTDVVFITAFGAVPDAVAALKDGATDYLTKPFRLEELRSRIDQIAQNRSIQNTFANARATLAQKQQDLPQKKQHPIVGQSPNLKRVLDRTETFAQSEYPVLILGESGTGKELIAKMLHTHSARQNAPFIAVNCASFPETLIEAELFGYKRGAFTGAFQDREGRFKAANHGTLFLDEIAEMPLPAQAKLLRVLQEGCFEPLGTNQSAHVDVRIISATHRNLRQRVQQGVFREDLYYRLKVLGIEIPPLRERRSDLALLIEYFLQNLQEENESVPRLSARAMAALTAYPFPGNVRELEHAVQHAAVLARGQDIDLGHLPSEIAGHNPQEAPETLEGGALQPLAEAMDVFEREYLLRALRLAHNKRTLAASILGISRKNLWQKLRRHGLLDLTDEDI